MKTKNIVFTLVLAALAFLAAPPRASAINCVTNVTVMAQPQLQQCNGLSTLTGNFPPGQTDHHSADGGFTQTGLSCIADSCTQGTLFCYSMPCCAPPGGFNAIFVVWSCDKYNCLGETGGSFSIKVPAGQSTIYFRIFPGDYLCTLKYCIVGTASVCEQ
jgi:hypothetical protein